MYVIGENAFGEFGLDHKKQMLKLFKHPQAFKQVVCGKQYNIYIDMNNTFWSSGTNSRGQCGVDKTDFSIPNLTEITYFKTNNIKIKKACASVIGCQTSWISYKNKLYMNGGSIVIRNYELPWSVIRNHRRYEPILIPELNHVIDACSAWYYSIALCSIPIHMLISYWFRMNFLNKIMPNDVRNLLIMFYGNTNTVYSTTFSKYGGNGHTECNNVDKTCEWKVIEKLRHKQIIKISTGQFHSVFLEYNGTVWCCGHNGFHQLGLGTSPHRKHKPEPSEITYFTKNDIKIKDIKCGRYHNLVIDDENRVYSWGYNEYGECGIMRETERIIRTPKLIMYQAQFIDCGYSHSYIGTQNGHYLFGTNYHGECLKSQSKESWRPYCIDEHMEQHGKNIKRVHLGYHSTIIITE